MSISGGLSAAMSGLAAAARAAEIVSSNIANATTPGYGRREIQLSARLLGSTGQGVSVNGVLRHSDPVLISERRLAQAGSAGQDGGLAFLRRAEAALGTPDSAVSLSSRIADFDTALVEAASRPDSESRLAQVLQTAKALAGHIASAGTGLQTAREQADQDIGTKVERLNTALARVADLNGRIRSAGTTRDVSALLDQRQQIIDSVAELVPLREVPRENGQVALFTTGGAVLLEGTPARFGFEPAGSVTPGMSLASGALSGLTLNGRAIATDGDGPLAGGALAADFAIRDQLAPQAQAELDALARDLVTRFADPAVDPSLATDAPGLFTESGAALQPGETPGLAQRLGVNAAADPAQGGALRRLRDGLAAATPGDVGAAGVLKAMQQALSAASAPASGLLPSGAHSFAGLAADMVSGLATARVSAEEEAGYSAARHDALSLMEKEGAVDTDQEMQSLLQIEQAYAANAKVIAAVGEMLQKLLEI